MASLLLQYGHYGWDKSASVVLAGKAQFGLIRIANSNLKKCVLSIKKLHKKLTSMLFYGIIISVGK